MDNIYFQLGTVALCVFLFQFRNRNKKLIHLVSFFIGCCAVAPVLDRFEGADALYYSFGFASSVGLLITYFIRFGSKTEKKALDYLKCVGIVLLAAYVFVPYLELRYSYYHLSLILSEVTFPILAFLYLYDRIVLNPIPMKRKFVVILVVQSIFILLFFVFALYQKAEVDIQRQEAFKQRDFAAKAEQQCIELMHERNSRTK